MEFYRRNLLQPRTFPHDDLERNEMDDLLGMLGKHQIDEPRRDLNKGKGILSFTRESSKSVVINRCEVEAEVVKQQNQTITMLYLIDCQECKPIDIEIICSVINIQNLDNPKQPIYYVLIGSMNDAKVTKYDTLKQLKWEVNSGTSFSLSAFDQAMNMVPEYIKEFYKG